MVYDVCLSLLSKKNKALKNQLNVPRYVLRDTCLPCLGWCLVTIWVGFLGRLELCCQWRSDLVMSSERSCLDKSASSAGSEGPFFESCITCLRKVCRAGIYGGLGEIKVCYLNLQNVINCNEL